eukprot:10676480-Lingulodinium_polyedra.AAC.1
MAPGGYGGASVATTKHPPSLGAQRGVVVLFSPLGKRHCAVVFEHRHRGGKSKPRLLCCNLEVQLATW